jgi:hypothetical protein
MMSKYSESYHHRSSIIGGIELLRGARLRGAVLPESNRWVTILPEGDLFIPKESLIPRNLGTLLLFANSEGHAWWFSVYVNSELIAS